MYLDMTYIFIYTHRFTASYSKVCVCGRFVAGFDVLTTEDRDRQHGQYIYIYIKLLLNINIYIYKT